MAFNEHPFITFMVSLVSVSSMEYLDTFDTIIAHSIQYAIGILTILYLIKKLKQIKPEKE